MIDFEHVSKQYKHNAKPALEDVNFHVDDGEFVFLLGHSGAGKSTLLKLILREETPTEGRVLVNGQDVARLRRRKIPYLRRQMGIIFQDFRLIPSMTVYENVAFAMHVLNVPRKEIRPRVEYILELVSKMGITVLVVTHEHELVHRFHQRVVTLSHGRIVSDVPADPVAAAEDDLSLDVAAFDADDASAAKKEVAAV